MYIVSISNTSPFIHIQWSDNTNVLWYLILNRWTEQVCTSFHKSLLC